MLKKEVTSYESRAFGASCRREFEKVYFCLLWNHLKSVMHVRSIPWFRRLATSTPCAIPNTPSHSLTCSRKRSLARVKTSKSLMMVPHLNSVVFHYKTTTWSCLSWTTCSHVCSRTNSCFGACYRSSFPENLAMSSHRFVLQTFISLSRLDGSGMS